MYELMVVGSGKIDPEEMTGRVKKILEEVSVANLQIEKLGKKLLAYPIAKQTEGEYLLFNFEVEPAAVAGITSALRLEQEKILRYLLTRVSRVSPIRQAQGKRVSKVAIAEGTEKKRRKKKVSKSKSVKLQVARKGKK